MVKRKSLEILKSEYIRDAIRLNQLIQRIKVAEAKLVELKVTIHTHGLNTAIEYATTEDSIIEEIGRTKDVISNALVNMRRTSREKGRLQEGGEGSYEEVAEDLENLIEATIREMKK